MAPDRSKRTGPFHPPSIDRATNSVRREWAKEREYKLLDFKKLPDGQWYATNDYLKTYGNPKEKTVGGERTWNLDFRLLASASLRRPGRGVGTRRRLSHPSDDYTSTEGTWAYFIRRFSRESSETIANRVIMSDVANGR